MKDLSNLEICCNVVMSVIYCKLLSVPYTLDVMASWNWSQLSDQLSWLLTAFWNLTAQ